MRWNEVRSDRAVCPIRRSRSKETLCTCISYVGLYVREACKYANPECEVPIKDEESLPTIC